MKEGNQATLAWGFDYPHPKLHVDGRIAAKEEGEDLPANMRCFSVKVTFKSDEGEYESVSIKLHST